MPVVATLLSSPVATAAMRRLLLVSSRNRCGITIPILVSMQGTVRRGPIFEVTDRNDPVIEEGYKDYVVPGVFSEKDYKFALFDDSKCSDKSL